MTAQKDWLEKDFYQILGVSETSPAKEITKTYRKLARKLHPDANPNDDAPEADYSDWGKRYACLRYLHFIAYVVRSIQELRERIERLKNNKM